MSPINCLLFSWPELKSWQWLSFLLLQPWYVPEELQLLLMQVELLQGWLRQVRLLRVRLLRGPLLREPLLRGSLLRGPLLRWPLLRGPLLRGPLLRRPLLRGPLLRRPLLRGPLVLVLLLLNGEQPFSLLPHLLSLPLLLSSFLIGWPSSSAPT